MSQELVLEEIILERIRQDEKWGVLSQRVSNDVMEWFVILMEEVGEASQEALNVRYARKSNDDLYTELVQCAAVCVAMLEGIKEGLI